MTRLFEVEVLRSDVIEVEIDEEKLISGDRFGEVGYNSFKEWNEDFRKSFYPFSTIREHAEHLAQMQARRVYRMDGGSGGDPNEFVEGYGPLQEAGIRVKHTVLEEIDEITATEIDPGRSKVES